LTCIPFRRQRQGFVNASQTRTGKAAAQTEYSKAQKEVKRSVKKDKNDNNENTADKAEQAAHQWNMKELYDLTRKLAGK
jgi:hypothetical protein